MSVILEKFLIKNNYTHFNRKDISLQLQTHPQYPSFRAITDTLDYFGIENVAATVPEDSLSMMPANFLTLIGQNDQQLVLAVKNDRFVYTYSEDKKREKHTYSQFEKIWSNKIIAIEDTAKKSGHVTMLKILGGLFGLGILVAFLWLNGIAWDAGFVLVLSGIGLYISLLLVKEKMGYHSAAVHSICTSITNSNCDEVINSKGSMLTKHISLADASFLYFSILIFQTIFFGYNSTSALLILGSIPVIIFSLYYQAVALKKWCTLCLGVVVVLIALNIIVFPALKSSLSLLQVIEFFMSVVILIPVYFLIKNLLVRQKSNEDKLFAASQFKRNPDIIRNFIKDARIIEDLSIMQNEIRIGNPDGMHKMIAFTNPFCGFCKAAFESYVKIIKAHPDIEIWIRFNSALENLDATSTKITARLVEIYFENGQNDFINAFLHWFEEKDEKGWLKKYGNPKFQEKTILILKAHLNWAIKNSITYTPATVIDGKEFPSFYGYEDLTLVMGDVIEF